MSSLGMVSRLGDLIADASLEGLYLFEKTNAVRLCKEAIRWQICELDDIASYFSRRVRYMAQQYPIQTLKNPFSLLDVSLVSASRRFLRRR
jgi:hypothetical protein